jgi:hypothetical protein
LRDSAEPEPTNTDLRYGFAWRHEPIAPLTPTVYGTVAVERARTPRPGGKLNDLLHSSHLERPAGVSGLPGARLPLSPTPDVALILERTRGVTRYRDLANSIDPADAERLVTRIQRKKSKLIVRVVAPAADLAIREKRTRTMPASSNRDGVSNADDIRGSDSTIIPVSERMRSAPIAARADVFFSPARDLAGRPHGAAMMVPAGDLSSIVKIEDWYGAVAQRFPGGCSPADPPPARNLPRAA